MGVRVERVNRIKVFEGAGWKCQICDRETPRSLLKDHRHPLAPTLDHVVPISKGGSHTYDNVQCLCRRCNSHKGVGPQPTDLPSILRVLLGKHIATVAGAHIELMRIGLTDEPFQPM